MDYELLAELLFPNVTKTPEEIEAMYPPRNLPEGAKVTRFAPSPTGFVHFGGLFPSTVGERLAHQSGGVFYLRIEDTDAKREVDGAAEALINTLAEYGLHFDEGAALDENGKICDKGAYGPYKQSERGFIYHVYAKKLVKEGKAYPCFTTEEELEALHDTDKKAEIKAREWTPELEAEQKAAMLKQREFTIEEVKEHLAAGHPFVLRMLADGDPDRKIKFTDLIKGTIEIPENDKDEVLLKSDGIPTYHFAHAVDDHLMGTTHVIRGEEWLPSLSRHIMLFRFLGFRLPKYMHISQIMRLDENGNKKKLSKRDMGANLSDYAKKGYSAEAVNEYVMTLLNSNYEEWHTANPEKPLTDFPFSIRKMSGSGCLFDFEKLNDVSKNILSKKTADEVYDAALAWAKENDADLADHLAADPAYAKKILAIGRGGKKPRKDLTTWADVKPYIRQFYDDWFAPIDVIDEKFDRDDIKKALTAFTDTYDETDDSAVWFDKIKAICPPLGYCPEMKLYKQDPTAYKGHVGDVSMFLRVAVTGMLNSPDLYEVIHILGKERTLNRVASFLKSL
ncbi:MAG: glutamate--tRNA ligase [Lachnospiraceae bacterium]|nr:glutamate--tRNA ligase [Lachnospiraceae bacterium]